MTARYTLVLLALLCMAPLASAVHIHPIGSPPYTTTTLTNCGGEAVRPDNSLYYNGTPGTRYNFTGGGTTDSSTRFFGIYFRQSLGGVAHGVTLQKNGVIASSGALPLEEMNITLHSHTNTTPTGFIGEFSFVWPTTGGWFAGQMACSLGAGEPYANWTTRGITSWVGGGGNPPVGGWAANNASEEHAILTYDYSVLPGPVGAIAAKTSPTECSITVNWDEPDPVPSSYNIYRSTTEGQTGSLVANTTAPPWVDVNVTPLVTYFYSVASNYSGVETEPGPQANFSLPRRCLRPPIFDTTNGTIYGGDRVALAEAWGVRPDALSYLYGMFFIVGLSITGYTFARSSGATLSRYSTHAALAGAVLGVVLSVVWDFIPLVYIVLFAAAALALYLMWQRRSGAV